VFRLLRLILILGGLCGFAWFGMTVPLGDRTLFGHVQAIWKTQESQDLVQGTKKKVGSLVDRATDKVVKGVAKNSPNQVNSRTGGAVESEKPPMEQLQEQDRKALQKLIGQGLKE
jgi:hypothetical protein